MKWLSLKLSSLPLIAVETDQVIKQYERKAQITLDLKQKINKYALSNDIMEFNNLKSQIERRIVMLDKFYIKYHLDEVIPLFHMLKTKLQRTIFKSEFIDDGSVQLSIIHPQTERKQFESESMLLDQFIFKKGQPKQILQRNNIQIQKGQQKKTSKNATMKLGQSYSNKHFPSNLTQRKQIQKKYTVSINNKAINTNKSAINTTKQKIIDSKILESKRLALSKSKSKDKKQQRLKTQPERIQKKGFNSTIIKKQTHNKNTDMRIQQTDESVYNKMDNENEFRFTIKMTKQQYKNFLKLKQNTKPKY